MTDLGRRLEMLAERLDVPEHEGDIARTVTARVATIPAPRVRRRTRRIVAAAAAAVVAAIAVPVAPAVADWLGIGGVEVRSDAPDPTVPMQTDEELGRRVLAREAEAALGEPLARPTTLGGPDAVWLDERGATAIVTLDYGDVLVTQFLAPLAPRDVVLSKFAGPDVRVEEAEVGGSPALWLEGAHGIALREANGGIAYVAMRLSANALVWERDGTTFRVETRGSKESALTIARSIR